MAASYAVPVRRARSLPISPRLKGHKRHASEDEPQYEIQSDKTDHIAMHKDSALSKIDE